MAGIYKNNEFDVTGLSYDKDGNIQALSRRFEGLKTYSYSYTSGTNRLAMVNKNGSNINFGYACPERSRRNPNGNVNTIGTGYSITGTTYNWKNLPTAITKSGTTYNYRYDHAGLRVYKQEGDNIHTLRGAFGEVLATYKNGSLDYWNIVRPDGAVIGRREGSNRLYYHRDHLGSTRAVVNTSGSVVQTYDYYPFGLEMPGRSLTSGATARERFTGHERDEEVGLDYMQARRYAAEFGRFLSVDPITHTLNPRELFDLHNGKHFGNSPYAYVFNNPLKYTDPTGLTPEDPEEIARFRQAEISTGLQHMLNLMNDHGVEIAAFMVQGSDGNVELVVFDFSENSADASHNPAVGTTAAGKKVYNGSEVIAQIHTHTNDNPTPSEADQAVSRQLRAPVFTLTDNNMVVTIGGPSVGFSDRNLGRSFRESVVNRGQSDRLVRYAQDLKGIIERQRRN